MSPAERRVKLEELSRLITAHSAAWRLARKLRDAMPGNPIVLAAERQAWEDRSAANEAFDLLIAGECRNEAPHTA